MQRNSERDTATSKISTNENILCSELIVSGGVRKLILFWLTCSV